MNTVQSILGHTGTLVGGSKGRYRHYNPTHVVYFNANVCTQEEGKIWWGDLDLTLSLSNLKKLSKELKRTLFVLSEMDGRFGNEAVPLLDRHVLLVKPTGEVRLGDEVSKYYTLNGNSLLIKPVEKVEPTPDRMDSVYDKKEYKRTRLPKKYNVKSKRNPLEQLHEVALERFPKLKEASMVYLTKEDYDVLNESLKTWLNNTKKYMDDYDKKKSLMWLMFDVGPAIFYSRQEWIKSGYVYIREKNDA